MLHGLLPTPGPQRRTQALHFSLATHLVTRASAWRLASSDHWPALLVPSAVPWPCPIGVSLAQAFHLTLLHAFLALACDPLLRVCFVRRLWRVLPLFCASHLATVGLSVWYLPWYPGPVPGDLSSPSANSRHASGTSVVQNGILERHFFQTPSLILLILTLGRSVPAVSPAAVGRGHAPMLHGLLPTPGPQRPSQASALTWGRGATTAWRGKSPRPTSRPAQAAPARPHPAGSE